METSVTRVRSIFPPILKFYTTPSPDPHQGADLSRLPEDGQNFPGIFYAVSFY